MAVTRLRASAAQAVLAGGRDPGQHGRAFVQVGQLGQVAGACGMGPRFEHRQRRQALGVLDAAVLPRLRQAVQAEVAAPAFEQGTAHRHTHHLGQTGQVAPEQLVLQGLGGGGQQHPFATEQGGHQVSVSLADTRAGFHHQRPTLFQGLRHGAGHGQLLLPGGVVVPGACQYPLRSKGVVHLVSQRQPRDIAHQLERQVLVRRLPDLRVFRHAGSSGCRDHSSRVIWSFRASLRFFSRCSTNWSMGADCSASSISAFRLACSMRNAIRLRCGDCTLVSIRSFTAVKPRCNCGIIRVSHPMGSHLLPRHTLHRP